MRFSGLLAHLAVGFDEPLTDFVELFRAVREQTNQEAAKFIADHAGQSFDQYQRDVHARHPTPDWAAHQTAFSDKQWAAWVAAADRVFDLSFRGKPGPGGGLAISPVSVSFFLLAFLVGRPLRDVVARARDMQQARYIPPAGEPDPMRCPVTGVPWFGVALTALLTERELFNRAVLIRVSPAMRLAQIAFRPEPPGRRELVSTFRILGKAKPSKAFFRESTLIMRDLGWLFDLVAAADAPAKTEELA
ncbi:MAG TPA: hypothetical protein VGG77_15195 [Roseiarcus sp.]|jgi:hypothetical protein